MRDYRSTSYSRSSKKRYGTTVKSVGPKGPRAQSSGGGGSSRKSSGGTPNRVSTKATDTYGTVGPAGWQPNQNVQQTSTATDTYGTVGPAGWQPNQNVQQTSTLSNNTFKGSGSNVVGGGSGAPTSGARRIGDAADAKGMTTWEGIKSLRVEHYLAAGGAEMVSGAAQAIYGQIVSKTGIFASKAGKQALTNKFWKGIVNKAPKTGKLMKTKGVTNPIQTTTKTGKYAKKIVQGAWDTLTKTKKTVTYLDRTTGKIVEHSYKSPSLLKPLAIAGGILWTVSSILEKSVGGQQFGQFLRQEGAAPINGAIITAQQAGDHDAFMAATALRYEMTDMIRENSNDFTPYIETAQGLRDFADLTDRATDIIVEVETNNELARQTGEDPYEVSRMAQLSQELFLMDAQDQINRQYMEAKEEAEKRSDARYARRLDDRITAERAAQQEQAEWLAQFWLDYRLMVIELENNNIPTSQESSYSNLKFGLL